MIDVMIAGAVRTPFGRLGGALREETTLGLAVLVVREALERAGAPAAEVDGVVLGNVLSDIPQSVYMAKYAGLRAGMDERITGLVVNRLCGSGLQAIVSAAQSIMLGEGSSYVAGGVEAMSGVPFQLPGARYGWRLGAGRVRDPLAGDEAGFIDPSCSMVMGATADRLAQRYGITREEADAFAWRSNQRALAANADGSFAADLVAIGDLLARDEHPRDSTPEQLATLRTIFTEDGVCTAGNSSGINDGGGAMLVTSDARARELGVVPRGRIVSWGITGCDPAVMGIGPVVATRLALDRAGLTLDDLDVIEINEAFAAQVLAVGKELEWDDARVNPHGGAVALGHPLGASGARLVVMLLRELEERDGGFGVATACIGGGQGIALIIERLGSR